MYAYELLASVKEITALSMLLTLGALVVEHRRWLGAAPVRAIPFALVLAAGVSALGLAFGAWALAAVIVLAVVLVRELPARRSLASAAVAALTLLVAAWPTWSDLPGAVRVAQRDRLHQQPRQPARTAARGAGARRVAARAATSSRPPALRWRPRTC